MTLPLRTFARGAALVAMLALLAPFHSIAADAPESSAEKQRKLIEILKSDAPPGEKGVACKRLAIYGTKEAVPVLAPLLANEQLSSWARIALQTIPGPEADEALRATLGTLQGRLLAGMINSIGIRRDAAAIPGLAAKLGDADSEVASAAAVALGNIGGDTAVKALQPLLASAPAPLRPAVAEGLIRAAERFLAEGNFAGAMALYDAVRAANVSRQKTLEATRGAILARRTEGVPLLREQLQSSDQAFFQIGLTVARELAGQEATRMLLAELDATTPDRQPYVLLAIADRGGAEALAIATKAARSVQPAMRITAIGVLERLADPSSIPVLLNASTDEDAGVSKAAKAAVSRVQGTEVDEAIIALFKRPEEKVRLTAIELAGQRRTLRAIPALLQAAEDPAPAIRTASLKVLADISTASEVAPLLRILMQTPQQDAVERVLAAICVRAAKPDSSAITITKAQYGDLPDGPKADVAKKVKALVQQGNYTFEVSNAHFGDPAGGRVKKLQLDYIVHGTAMSRTVAEGESITLAVSAAPSAIVDPLCAALPGASGAAKESLLRLLRVAGGPKALATVRAALADAGTKETALRMLCDWQTADALPDLVELAKSATDEKFRILALRGQLRLISLQAIPAGEKVAALKSAIALIQRAEEKRLALSALAEIPSADSLALIATYLGDADVKDDAGPALLAIAEQVAKTNPAAVVAALEPIAKSGNAQLAQRANAILVKAKAAAPK